MYDWVEKSKFDRLGIFTYSHEENTHAFKLKDNVPDKVKAERANEIMVLQLVVSYDLFLLKFGKTFKVLIDRVEGGNSIGRTEFDSPEVDNEVIIQTDKRLKIGEFVNVKIISCTSGTLKGEAIGLSNMN